MRVCHGIGARFDDPNLVSCAGLVPTMGLPENVSLRELVGIHLTLPDR